VTGCQTIQPVPPASSNPSRPMRILQVRTRHREHSEKDMVARAEAGLLTWDGHEVVVCYVAENPAGVVLTAASPAVPAWNPVTALALRSSVRPDVAPVHNTRPSNRDGWWQGVAEW
jgi:hypothetical protein